MIDLEPQVIFEMPMVLLIRAFHAIPKGEKPFGFFQCKSLVKQCVNQQIVIGAHRSGLLLSMYPKIHGWLFLLHLELPMGQSRPGLTSHPTDRFMSRRSHYRGQAGLCDPRQTLGFGKNVQCRIAIPIAYIATFNIGAMKCPLGEQEICLARATSMAQLA
jgi:hypothetical protein